MDKIAQSKLYLCLKKLRPLDKSVITVFLKILEKSAKTKYIWTIYECSVCSPESQPDIIFTSVEGVGLIDPRMKYRAFLIAYHHEKVPEHIQLPTTARPFQFEQIVQILMDHENALEPAVDQARTTSACCGSTAEPCGTAQTSEVLDLVDEDVQLKLTRWPRKEHIGQHREYARLASILLSRRMGYCELVAVSCCTPHVTVAFIQEMRRHKNLEIHRNMPDALPLPKPAGTQRPTVTALVGRLRARLGLAQPVS